VIGWKPLRAQRWNRSAIAAEVLYRVSPIDGRRIHAGPCRRHPPAKPRLRWPHEPEPDHLRRAEAIGTAISAQEHAGRFFSGGANFDYALKTASKMDKTQLEQLKASLIARVQNGGRGPLILGGGLEPAQLSVNSKDAEILATRLFTVEEICRIFGVPPHMVGHTDKTRRGVRHRAAGHRLRPLHAAAAPDADRSRS
jgi:hypothetical protein